MFLLSKAGELQYFPSDCDRNKIGHVASYKNTIVGVHLVRLDDGSDEYVDFDIYSVGCIHVIIVTASMILWSRTNNLPLLQR